MSENDGGTAELRVRIPGHEYSVFVGDGVYRILPALIARLPDVSGVVVIADATVARLHVAALSRVLGSETTVVEFDPGESSKSLATAARIYDRLADLRLDRSGLLVTFGGGVAGDLGGFVAATWMRGVRYLQLPTTVEAAVDASVGGKTAVNHPRGKNLIGAFHQPVVVVIDTRFLETLPDRDFRAGIAESVKHALIRDPGFLTWHEEQAEGIAARKTDAIQELIVRNCRIKADVVSQDEREQGLREILNFGHTVGHAIEHVSKFNLRHGECVGLGMLVENEISRKRGMLSAHVCNRVRTLLARLGLPTTPPNVLPSGELLAATRLDKKARRAAVKYVLLRDVGDPVRVSDVSDDEVAAALARALQPGQARA